MFLQLLEIILSPVLFLFLFLSAFLSRFSSSKNKRLVWGEAPIINNVTWARAMEEGGFFSETFTDQYCSSLNKREEYDLILQEMFGKVLIYDLSTIWDLFILCSDMTFFISYNGFFYGKQFWLEQNLYFLKFLRKKL